MSIGERHVERRASYEPGDLVAVWPVGGKPETFGRVSRYLGNDGKHPVRVADGSHIRIPVENLAAILPPYDAVTLLANLTDM